MADEQRQALGPAGEVLMKNIQRIRTGQQLSYVELAERLAAVGRPVPVLGLRRIERGERRVDVDDLLALAHVLGVAPAHLLVPGDLEADAPYPVTPEVSATAAGVRDWISGLYPLVQPPTPADMAKFIQWMPKDRAQAVTREWIRREDIGSPRSVNQAVLEGEEIRKPFRALFDDGTKEGD